MILVPDLPTILQIADSNAEKHVARLLSSVVGPQDAVAFYSVKLRSHKYKQQAEADFVLLWNGLVVVIEVKGGGVRNVDGVWWSIDRHGEWHKLTESPMDQATSAMHALTDVLREEGVGWFPREAVVITPDIEAPPHAVGWKPTHWLARDEMTIEGLSVALTTVTESNSTGAPRNTKVARPKDLRDRLFGEFTRMPVIDAQRGAVIEEQNRATEDQARVLASLARNDRVMVLGGAGTGKSLVLVEAAKLEAETGRSVLITFHSPDLARFFEPFIGERDIDLIAFGDLPDRDWDVVLIDEAQDLMTVEAMDRLDSVIKGGRSAGRWRMFLDPNNQAHVDGRFDSDVFEIVAAEALSLDLRRNVRNTKAIVHVVQQYLGADIGDPGIVLGDAIRWHWSSGAADVDEAAGIARELIANGASRKSIWIISVSGTPSETSTHDSITVTTPRTAKGFEADYVIACDLPSEYDAAGLAAFYVAVTRARVGLHIVATPDDKKRLQELAQRRGGTR
ncbi:NERD nuclease [Mycobacterium sp. E136]|uniref:nuclease-related domain-containing DEAD/DEAH box helicase n=1 Tax=Mycobacterium sp. E136 TaxID=1834125 RepID=UPI0007FCB650|nr:NERD domain-containing protein [Mycobacterium sp. E136]OBG91814.1 NERD nuclease [Mycobacterium sp. E136]